MISDRCFKASETILDCAASLLLKVLVVIYTSTFFFRFVYLRSLSTLIWGCVVASVIDAFASSFLGVEAITIEIM